MTANDDVSQLADLAPQNIIRVETALSRYPVHRLAKQGTIAIEIREESSDGEKLINWEVSHNSHYGQPGPLAYKLDTLIVNRRIEEASRPIPKVIRLGSLHEICREIDVRGGKPRENVKNALYQNASAFIKTKLRYRGNDGSVKSLEAGFSRYSVVFTGEKLPDGRKANAVYIVLNDVFMQVLNGVQTRPLDYDYLKELPPASQRLYEILSYQMYSAIKSGRQHAKLSYAEFCTYAPLTRHEAWESVRSQMNKLHAPHKKSGYIASVEFEQTLDRNGKPDWTMSYAPGEKAKEEFRTFAKRGGPKNIEVEVLSPVLPLKTEPTPEPSPLERELTSRGITERTAAQLVEAFPAARIEAQIEHFDWLKAKEPKSIVKSDGGFLVEAIRNNYPMPNGFETKSERENRLANEKLKNEQERESAMRVRAAKVRDQELDRKADERWEAMSPEERTATEAVALAEADEDIRRSYEKSPPKFQRPFLERIRQSYLRRVIEQEEAASNG